MELTMTGGKKIMKLNKIKASFKSKYFKIGGYSTVISAAVLAIVVVINLFAASVPAIYTKLDTSGNELYTISEETENIVRAINEDVTVYFIAEKGAEDSTIEQLLGRYTSLNSHIKVRKIDPGQNPNFTANYTENRLSPNSLIFESERRSHIVDNSEIYLVSYSDQEIANYYQYGITPTGSKSFAGESEITGALEYVTSDSIPIIYMLGGHGESPFGESLKKYIANDNIEIKDLSLLTTDSVPSDASCLVINNPTADISTAEIEKIRTYLGGGGYMILLTSYSETAKPNLMQLTSDYGAEYTGGMIIEGNANYYLSGYPYLLLPKLGSNEITSLISNDNIYVAMPEAHGIAKSETLPDNITVTSLLTTSAAAYLKEDAYNIESLEKEEGDVAGPFDVGVLIKDSSTGAQIVWFSSARITDDQFDLIVSGGNSTYFLSTLTYLCEKEASVSIAAKSMQVAALVIDDLSSNIWGSVITIILPAGTIILGLCLWLRRRKR
jgi:ABC-2 type transport system permease protein